MNYYKTTFTFFLIFWFYFSFAQEKEVIFEETIIDVEEDTTTFKTKQTWKIIKSGSNFNISKNQDGNFTIIDIFSNKQLLNGQYEFLEILNNYLLLASKDQKMGLINLGEDQLIPFEYEKITESNKPHLFKVTKNGYVGLFDLTQNQVVIPTEYERITPAENGYIVKKGKEVGFVYLSGNRLKFALPLEYANIHQLNNGNLKVIKNRKRGIYNIFGKKFVVPIMYGKIAFTYSPFNFKAYLAYENGRISILNNYNFKPIIDQTFGKVYFKKGFLIGKDYNFYTVFTQNNYFHFRQVEELIILNSNLIKIKKFGKWGIYSEIHKKMIMNCTYNNLDYDATTNTFNIEGTKYKMIGKKLTKQ